MNRALGDLADRIQQGDQPRTPVDLATARAGEQAGWLARDAADQWQFLAQRRVIPAFLPKSLVGDDKGSPIAGSTIAERIRKARDPLAFRLLVDLYRLQDMANLCGVDRTWLWQAFERGSTSAASGSTVVWTYTLKSKYARVRSGPLAHHWHEPTEEEAVRGRDGASAFYERLEILEDAGALEWAIHLTEDESPAASPIYPVGIIRHGTLVPSETESIIGSYATRAACAIGGYADQAAAWDSSAPNRFIVPADRMARKATLVGIARLRHRPRTSNVSLWRHDLLEVASAQIPVFRGIIAAKAPHVLAEIDRRVADFNVDFNEASTLVQSDLNDTGQSGKPSPLLTERLGAGPLRSDRVPAADDRAGSNAEEQTASTSSVFRGFQRTGTEERF